MQKSVAKNIGFISPLHVNWCKNHLIKPIYSNRLTELESKPRVVNLLYTANIKGHGAVLTASRHAWNCCASVLP
jgi:hypothetical protein